MNNEYYIFNLIKLEPLISLKNFLTTSSLPSPLHSSPLFILSVNSLSFEIKSSPNLTSSPIFITTHMVQSPIISCSDYCKSFPIGPPTSSFRKGKIKSLKRNYPKLYLILFFCPDGNLLTYTALSAQGNREKVEMLIKGPSTPFSQGGHLCELYIYMKEQVQ